ncbi:MAG TPA: hypothetical protein VJU86_17985 [Pyrinomonadaceae bacterium]|nr:hypothetical protein [Pyrinomonadaceae bacterium]
METDVIRALMPAFAAGFANQRLMEILDPLFVKRWGEESKGTSIGIASFLVGLGFALGGGLRTLKYLGAENSNLGFQLLDFFVTGLVISAGTDGFNSILKFLSYKKEEQKEGALAEMINAESARAIFERRVASNFFATPAFVSEPKFERSGDLPADLTKVFMTQLRRRFPDQFREQGWEDRKFNAYVTELKLLIIKDAAVNTADIVAQAYGVTLLEDARGRIQNAVKLDSNPKQLLPVMLSEVEQA